MSILIKSPYPIYTDIDGDPLEDGFIFIGEPGLNPLSSPLQVYWDAALTVPASNIRTKGGYPSNSGTPGQLFVDSDYSFLLQDKKGAQVLYTAYSRDTPLIYETEEIAYQDNDIITPSLVHLIAVLDVGLGDAFATLEAPTFIGQKCSLLASGTGIAEYNVLGISYSLYVTEGLRANLEGISDGVGGFKWDVGSQVSAKKIYDLLRTAFFYTDRRLIHEGKRSTDIETASSTLGGFRSSDVAISFSDQFADTEYRGRYSISSNNTVSVLAGASKTTSSYDVRFWNGSSQTTATRQCDYVFEGEYA